MDTRQAQHIFQGTVQYWSIDVEMVTTADGQRGQDGHHIPPTPFLQSANAVFTRISTALPLNWAQLLLKD